MSNIDYHPLSFPVGLLIQPDRPFSRLRLNSDESLEPEEKEIDAKNQEIYERNLISPAIYLEGVKENPHRNIRPSSTVKNADFYLNYCWEIGEIFYNELKRQMSKASARELRNMDVERGHQYGMIRRHCTYQGGIVEYLNQIPKVLPTFHHPVLKMICQRTLKNRKKDPKHKHNATYYSCGCREISSTNCNHNPSPFPVTLSRMSSPTFLNIPVWLQNENNTPLKQSAEKHKRPITFVPKMPDLHKKSKSSVASINIPGGHHQSKLPALYGKHPDSPHQARPESSDVNNKKSVASPEVVQQGKLPYQLETHRQMVHSPIMSQIHTRRRSSFKSKTSDSPETKKMSDMSHNTTFDSKSKNAKMSRRNRKGTYSQTSSKEYSTDMSSEITELEMEHPEAGYFHYTSAQSKYGERWYTTRSVSPSLYKISLDTNDSPQMFTDSTLPKTSMGMLCLDEDLNGHKLRQDENIYKISDPDLLDDANIIREKKLIQCIPLFLSIDEAYPGKETWIRLRGFWRNRNMPDKFITGPPPSPFMSPQKRTEAGLQQLRSQQNMNFNPPMPRPPLFSTW